VAWGGWLISISSGSRDRRNTTTRDRFYPANLPLLSPLPHCRKEGLRITPRMLAVTSEGVVTSFTVLSTTDGKRRDYASFKPFQKKSPLELKPGNGMGQKGKKRIHLPPLGKFTVRGTEFKGGSGEGQKGALEWRTIVRGRISQNMETNKETSGQRH